jgi:hypothetical protein
LLKIRFHLGKFGASIQSVRVRQKKNGCLWL